MNEKLRPFIEQAIENSLFEPFNPAVAIGENDVRALPVVVFEEFAQLLIQECSQFTDPGVKVFLFKHFGIE